MAAAFVAVGSFVALAPLNPGYRYREMDFYLGALDPAALLVWQDDRSPAVAVARERGIRLVSIAPAAKPGCFELIPVDEDERVPGAGDCSAAGDADTALVIQTSGTTGMAKVVALSHANVCASGANVAATLGLSPADRCLNVVPLFNVHGLISNLLGPLCSGGSTVCAPFSANDFHDQLRATGATWYSVGPASLKSIFAHTPAVTEGLALRFIRSGSAAVPAELARGLEQRFNVPVIGCYGMTETSGLVTSDRLPPGLRKPGSVGLAPEDMVRVVLSNGTDAAIGEVGEVRIQGPGVMSGYLNNERANRESFVDEWFRTGDLGYLDQDRYLFLSGRMSENINRGGDLVQPLEIDQVLMEHPAVREAVAFPVPHDTLGEDIVAAVVLHDQRTFDEPDIRSFLFERLAAFKVPSQLLCLAEIPTGPTGKVRRRTLSQELAARLATADAPPESPTEETLVAIWKDVLGLQSVGCEDNFFLLGGDSLSAVQMLLAVNASFGADVKLEDIFTRASTIRAMATVVNSACMNHSDRKIGHDPYIASDEWPCTAFQRGLWITSRVFREHSTFITSGALRLTGRIDLDALRASLEYLVERHDMLRTVVASRVNSLVQTVDPTFVPCLDVADLHGETHAEQQTALHAAVQRLAYQPFDLTSGPLWRTKLYRFNEEEHVWVIVLDHMIADGWSRSLLIEELAASYARVANGLRPALPPLSSRFGDFALRASKQPESSEASEAIGFWRSLLDEKIPTLALPTDRSRPQIPDWHGNRVRRRFASSVASSLTRLAHSKQATMFMMLLSGFYVLAYKLTGQTDIAIGVPLANRTEAGMADTVGNFTNALPFRARLCTETGFEALVEQVRENAIGVYAHQSIPLDIVTNALGMPGDLNFDQPFPVLFQLRNYGEVRPGNYAQVHMERLDIDPGISPFELSVELSYNRDELDCMFEYKTSLFEQRTIEHFVREYERVLLAALKEPAKPLARL
jgi:acyl-CoA synthetase (AMP-forming)/AMP-acid ligase II/acyl carrier protein